MRDEDVATKVKEIKEERKRRKLLEKLQKRRKMISFRHLSSAGMNVIIDREAMQS